MVKEIWSIIFCTICTLTDVKERKINILFCLANQILMTLVYVSNGDFNINYIFAGILFGGVFFIVNKISKNGIGMGDVFMIMSIGVVCGATYTTEILLWSFGICSIFAIVELAFRKINLKSSLPLAPFMLLGSIVTGLFRMEILM